ncbi:MAG TPA: hypothetical protein VF598_14085, partial [Hymenobacter sp.]
MAEQIVRNFQYQEGNLQGQVFFNVDTLDVRFAWTPLDPAMPTDETGFIEPSDGVTDGEALLQPYCQVVTGERTGASIAVVARNGRPYAEAIRTNNSALCTATVVCDLDVLVSYDTQNKFVVLTVSTTHGPWSSSADNITYFLNQVNFSAQPGQSGKIYVKDEGNCNRTVDYLMPGGSGGTGSEGESIDNFETGGESVSINFKLDRTPLLLARQAPEENLLPDPISPDQRGRLEDSYISSLCKGTTKYEFYATLSPPYARLVATPNSTDCGYVGPVTPPVVCELTLSVVVNGATATATVTKAVGVVRYSINNGASWQSSFSFPGLAAGNYVMLAEDTGLTGCRKSAAFIIAGTSGGGQLDTDIPVGLDYALRPVFFQTSALAGSMMQCQI